MRITKHHCREFIQKLIDDGGNALVTSVGKELYGDEPEQIATAQDVAMSCRQKGCIILSHDGSATVIAKGREFCGL